MGIEPTLLLVTGPPGTGKSTVAEAAADRLGAAVLAWDWVMAALTPLDDIQAALRRLDRDAAHRVGWSVLWNLAVAQLRQGRSAVLDGCARAPEVESTRLLAAAEEVTCRVVVTRCRDVELHRARLDRRTRNIPGWYELDWAHVADFLSRWDEPPGADLALDAADPLPANLTRLSELLAPGRRRRQHR